MNEEQIKEKLRSLLENSCSTTYHYYVAAIIRCNDNKLFEGVNVETSSPSSGICAERNALYNAITNGYHKGDFKEIYIMNKTDQECFPCFVCRQALNDFCSLDTKVITYNYSGTKKEVVTIKDLCVYPFDSENLK